METVSELRKYVASLPDAPANYRIAVGSMTFTDDDKVILLERSAGARDSAGFLEGVGGGVDDGEENLYDVLRREIKEEIGDVDVQIDEPLAVKILPSSKDPNLKWVAVDYLCRLVRGTPKNIEPHRCKAIHKLKLPEIPRDRLSPYQLVADKTYTEKYGNQPYYK